MRRISQRPDAAGEGDVLDARRVLGEARAAARARRRCWPSSCSAGCAEQPLAGAVDEHAALLAVEGEDRDVDLRHHRPQQRARLERAEPLVVQRLGERVDFEHHRAERIVAAGAARADREVALAQRGQQVRQRLQRQHDAMAHAERAAGPDADDEHGQRPLDFRRVVAGPEQDQRDQRAEAGGERQQQDARSKRET